MDAISLLKADHAMVDRLFKRYESLGDAPEEKERIVHEFIRELSIHATIEELVLYPEVRTALPDGDSLADEALQEHREAKQALSDLDDMDSSDPDFDLKVANLISDVRHHVEEEEEEMFPKLESALSRDRLEDMGERMEQAKKTAPTRPHPLAPDRGPAAAVTGTVAGAVDRFRDVVSGRQAEVVEQAPRKRPSRTTARKKPASRKPTASKAAGRGATFHVTADPKGGWRAERQGSNRAVARGSTKQEVVAKARDQAKSRGGVLVIHKENGRIQERRNYG
jgi:hemerythrin superfamily protein